MAERERKIERQRKEERARGQQKQGTKCTHAVVFHRGNQSGKAFVCIKKRRKIWKENKKQTEIKKNNKITETERENKRIVVKQPRNITRDAAREHSTAQHIDTTG